MIISLFILKNDLFYAFIDDYQLKGQGKSQSQNVSWSPAGGGGRSAIQFISGVDAIVAGGGGGGGGGAGIPADWNPATTGPLSE